MTAAVTASVRQPYVVFGKPDIRQPEIDDVLECLANGWIGTGPKVERFERAMAEYLGVAHAVATNSCTAALHLALLACGVGPGDEVIVPSLTFCATANVVVHVGARPVLVDVARDSQGLTVQAVEAARTPRTRAILPVHFAGWPVPMAPLRALADRHGLALIQDAAHCLEGRLDDASPSRFGDVTCYSFYVTKNVVTGEGGMAVTADAALAGRMRTLRLHGIDADAWKRFTAAGYRHYECVVPGFKYNMTDMQAAMGIHQLARVEENLRTRERQWRCYQTELAELPLELPACPSLGIRHARHLYTVQVRPEAPLTRDALMQGLHGVGIGSGVHYRPVHVQPLYRERFGYRPEDCPVAHDIGQRTLSLPLGPALTDDEQTRVIAAVRQLLA